MKATLVKANLRHFTGRAALYRLDPPLATKDYDDEPTGEAHEYVVVSATVTPYSGPETYIFPADAEGKVTNWGELDGSFRGDLDHAEALRRAGYDIE